MTQLYTLAVALLVAATAFNFSLAAITLAGVLCFYALRSFISSVRLNTGLSYARLEKEILWEAVLVGVVYAVGVVVLYAHFPVISLLLTPWVVHISAINIISVLYGTDIIDIDYIDDDEYEEDVDIESEVEYHEDDGPNNRNN